MSRILWVWVALPFALLGLLGAAIGIRRVWIELRVRRLRRRLDKPFDRRTWGSS